MITLPAILDPFLKAGAAVQEFVRWKNRQKGNGKLLILELQNNFTFLHMVSRGEATLDDVLENLSTAEYRRLLADGFQFRSLAPGKIGKSPSLRGTSLQPWAGRDTADLIDSLYSRIEELKIRYPHNRDNRRYNWKLRANNILRLILLLLNHQSLIC